MGDGRWVRAAHDDARALNPDHPTPRTRHPARGTLRLGRGSPMPTAFFAIPYFIPRDPAPHEKLEAAGWTVRTVADGMHADADRLIDLLQGVDATVAGGEPYTRRVLTEATSLKHIAR